MKQSSFYFYSIWIVDRKYSQKAIGITLKENVNAIEVNDKGILTMCSSDFLMLSRSAQIKTHIPFVLYDGLLLYIPKLMTQQV